MSDDLFESAKAVLRWAGEEIDEFKLVANTFAQSCEAKTFAQLDALTAQMVHGYLRLASIG